MLRKTIDWGTIVVVLVVKVWYREEINTYHRRCVLCGVCVAHDKVVAILLACLSVVVQRFDGGYLSNGRQNAARSK